MVVNLADSIGGCFDLFVDGGKILRRPVIESKNFVHLTLEGLTVDRAVFNTGDRFGGEGVALSFVLFVRFHLFY